jgi:diguanylate cyclase (GGDEF)-like protein
VENDIKIQLHNKFNTLHDLIDQLDYNTAIDLCNEILNDCIEINDIAGKIEVNQIMSRVSFNRSDYANAYEYALKAAELLEQVQSVNRALDNLNFFAKLMIRQEAFKEAIELLKKGLKIAHKYDKSKQVASMFNSIGEAHFYLQQYDTSEGYLKNALEIAQKNTYKHITEIKVNLARLYIAKGVFNVAKTFLEDAESEANDSNNVIQLIWCYILDANISYEKKYYDLAIDYAKKAEILSDKYEFNYELLCSYEWLHKAYAKQGEFEVAYDSSKKFIELQRKMNKKDREDILSRMRIKYDVYQYQKEMRVLKASYEKVTQQRQELQYVMDILGKQNEELLSIAINDYLTGAYNRKYFMLKFDEEFSIADEHSKDLACIVFDVDKFKGINDTYGHIAGDTVIKHIVNICNMVADKSDIIGRFGGDEFVIILMGKGLEDARNVGYKILETLRNSPVTVEEVEIISTISLGVTDNKIGHPNNAEDMIRIADKALYKAKDNGRNQLCIATEEIQAANYTQLI